MVTNTKCSLFSPELETVTQSSFEECGEEHHSLGIQNPAIDQKSLHVCAEVLMCIAACVCTTVSLVLYPGRVHNVR